MASMVITIFSLYFRQDITGRIDKISKDIVLVFKRKGYAY
jgi:hypothetical protein